MKAIRADLPAEHESIELVVVSDYHYSSPNSDKDAIRNDIEYIKSKDNAYCVLAGDLLDCALKTSLGDVYTNLSPMTELAAMVDLLQPIAHKVVAAVPGNHEERHYRTNGVEMTRLMTRQLGIEDKYSEDAAIIFLRVGRDRDSRNHNRPILYTIFLTHGSGGGKKETGKIQRLSDLADIADCDCYICGHTHMPAALKLDFIRTSPANSSFSYAPHLFVNAASKLRYSGYPVRGGFKPANLDTPRIIFGGTRKSMEAVI